MKKTSPITWLAVLSLLIIQCAPNTSKQTSEGDEPIGSSIVEGLEIGNKAPELVYNNPEGTPIALSSLEGKLVLIDFWASWCPPCRIENPNLVAAYETYKDSSFVEGEGFTVYGVSLDKNKDAWTAAIDKDKLAWEAHVSDLKYWNSEGASIYKVQSIPTNYLINGEGIIIAKNLKQEALHQKLKSLLK